MAIQKKNLLEAFQASAAADKAKAAASASSGAPKAGGPFAQPESGRPESAGPESVDTEAVRSPAAAPAQAPAASPLRRALATDGLQRLIVLQLVITIAAFFLGRASVSRVDASEGAAPPGEASAGLQQPGTPQAGTPQAGKSGGGQAAAQPQAGAPAAGGAKVVQEPGTPAERALLDPRNLYTVKVVEYRKGSDDAIALDTLRYFQEQGLPAVAQVQDGRLFILLGAAPTQAALADLLAEAKTMRGPPPLNKPAEFHDAYVVGIDRLGIR